MKKLLVITCLLLVSVGMAMGQGNLVPSSDSTKTLGTASLKWLEAYTDGVTVSGGEGSNGVVTVEADQGDDDLDTWTISATTGGDLEFATTESNLLFTVDEGGTVVVTNHIKATVDNVSDLGTSTVEFKDTYSDGISYMDAVNGGYSVKSNSYTATTADMFLTYFTGNQSETVTTNTLPEASASLGMTIWVNLGNDGGDLEVNTDGTDSFYGNVLGTSSTATNKITFADVGDCALLQAQGTNYWAVLFNVGGTLGTQ
jgi:hypothetical protein